MSTIEPTTSTRLQLPRTSTRRRVTDRIMRGALAAATMIALIPLVLVIYYLLKEGLGSMTSAGFFTQDPTGSFFGQIGGIRSALLGSLEIVGIAAAIAIPIGIGLAVFLVEYGGKGSKLMAAFANTVRYFVDVMTGVPSIIFGLFIYITLVISHVGGNFAGWKGSIALSLLMLPIIARSTELVLQTVPDTLREAALALGAPRWRVTSSVVLPAATPGIVTGSLLATARALGETAPLLFTVAVANALTFNPSQQMNSMPIQIYNDILSPRAIVQSQAWGAGLTLVLIILILNLVARGISWKRRSAVS
jgi:phosphate transport system permease protein